MNIRKEYVVIAVLVVALSLYLLLREGDRTQYELPEVAEVEKEAIDRLVVDRPGGEMTLEMRNGVWRVVPEGWPADETKVDAMREAFAGLEIGTLVSESKNYTLYELDDESRIRVEAFGGEASLGAFDIGKTAPTYRHTYVRLPGDERVYQAAGNLRRTFDLDADRVRDRDVLDAERSSVTGLTVAGTEGRVSLARIQKPAEPPAEGEPAPPAVTAWITPDSTEADGKVVDGILKQVTSLDADGFPPPGTEPGGHEYLVALEGTGDTLYIHDHLEDEKKYLATSSQYDFPFLLSEWKVKQIRKTPAELMGKEDEEESD